MEPVSFSITFLYYESPQDLLVATASNFFKLSKEEKHRSTATTILKQYHLFSYNFGSLSPNPVSVFPSRQNFAVLPISWLPSPKITFSRFVKKL